MPTVKGVVMESRGHEAVILTRSGQFKRVRQRKPAAVGEEITHREWGKELALYLAATAILFLVTWRIVDFFTVCVYATVEINPAIEMGLNSAQRVVKVTPLNEEGQALLRATHLKGNKVDKALEKVISVSVARGYLPRSGGRVLITVVPANNQGRGLQEEIIPHLRTRVNQVMADHKEVTAQVDVVKSASRTRKENVERGRTPATKSLSATDGSRSRETLSEI